MEIPEGVSARQEGNMVVVTGPKGTLKREFRSPLVTVEVKEKQIRITSAQERRRSAALVGTFAAHLRNMFQGVTSGFEARMKIIYSHFPIKMSVEGSTVVIQNFLGERSSRKVEILEGVAVEVRKEDVIVSGINKEDVGQTAGRIEKASKVKGYDRRIFQDGIHLTEKARPLSL